jgi:membrane fusion protein, multidrug efflux system
MTPLGTLAEHRLKAVTAVAILIVVGIAGILLYREYLATHVSTDDAYVEGNIHTVAPKVAGTIKAIHVQDNQYVKKGQPLVDLDSIDYDVRVNETSSSEEAERMRQGEAESRLDAARKQLIQIRAGIDAAKANVAVMRANLDQAGADMKRYGDLYGRGAIPKERNEKVQTAYEVQTAQLKAAQEQERQLEASFQVQTALVRQAEAALAAQLAAIKNKETVRSGAELNRSYTKICAPAEGYVTKKSAEVGNQVTPGMPLLAIVPLDDIWIVANYKETQVGNVRPKQKVTIKVDTYPGRTFSGIVDSITAGTGAVFSLFPPENASGNYVKVVQRIPVKIILDKDSNRDHLLRVGMSVVPTILTK